MTFKVIYLNAGSGELGRLPDNAIINAGGVVGPHFTVGGLPLLFADGTTTDGSPGVNLQVTLQQVYDSSAVAAIDLTAGKNFSINALNQKIFQVDASTGRVTITGDLTVLGSSTVIDGTLANVDQVSINPPDASTSALIIEPMVGVVMGTDVVRIRSQHAGPAVFTIDSAGNTSLKQLAVAGTINGVDFTAFHNAFQTHIGLGGTKHSADQISVDPTNFQNISGNDVQEVLESIDSAIGAGPGSGSILTHEHIQNTDATVWIITHGKGSMRATVTIYDVDYIQVYPDEVKVLDPNTVRVTFNTAQDGRAMILLF